MKSSRVALLGLVLLGCGKKPPPAPVENTTAAPAPAPAPAPAEVMPFSVTYTYKAKVDGSPLMFTLESDGRVDALTLTPPGRYTGKADASLVEDVARYVANPELRALPEKNENGEVPVIEVELFDAKGALWRRYFAGLPPKATAQLFDRLENLQRVAQKPDRPPGVVKIDLTRSPPSGGPVEVLSVNANSLVLKTVDGRPRGLGSVGGADLDVLRAAVGMLERTRATPPGAGTRHVLAIERGDDTRLDLRFEGGVPLVAKPLFDTLAELEAKVKPVADFDEISYRVPIPGKGKKRFQTLTVLPTGKLSLVAEDGTAIGSGEAAIEELWGTFLALVPFEAVTPGKPVGRGEDSLRVKSPSGERELRFDSGEAPPEAKKVVLYLNRFLMQLAPPPPE